MTAHFVDLRPCRGATLDNLDPAQIDAHLELLARRRPGSSLLRQPLPEFLTSIGAAVMVRGRPHPTLTGILFFGHEPQRFYPSFSITFLHFAGTTTARTDPGSPLYLDNREFQGTLPVMIDAARATVFEKLSKRALLEGFVRQDVPEYPESAYREAIVNALGHRDYGQEGSFVQVRLFADRLEVQSPGGLGGHLTVDNMVYEQYTRNPHIMQLLETYGYVERRGLGVDQMLRAMADAGLAAPVFQDRSTSFWVVLKGGSQTLPEADLTRLGLNDRQVRALHHLHTRGRISNREYQEEFDVSERTALNDLKALVDAGLALPVSSGRGRYYIPH